MKKIFFCISILLSVMAFAQTKNKSVKKQKPAKSVAKKTTIKTKNNKQNTVQLTSESTNAARVNTNTTTSFKIADPVTRSVMGTTNMISIHSYNNSPIVGVPKRAYGFANGHITLKPNSATSSGTINGSGSVGTGSFPGSVGTGSMVPGVNGKNQYAGVDIWGTRISGTGIQIKEANKNIKQ